MIISKVYIVALFNSYMIKKEISKEKFVDLYYHQNLTTYEISNRLCCSQTTIWKKFKEFNLKPRISGTTRVNLSKKILFDLYFNKKLSTWKIEKQLNISRGTIHRKLKEYKIPTRDLSTANMKYSKLDFSGDLNEKAYIIGFRLGDLRVRKQYLHSHTISIGCSSTIPEQIKLIKSLFKKYGHVWIKKSNNGKIAIEAFLNETFDFLLSKEIPFWVKEKDSSFYSFLSGFIDAEGCIGIYNKMARFSIGNYNVKLLNFLKIELAKRNIDCNLASDKRKGKLNSEGYPYRDNYTSLRINNKQVLSSLFKEVKPYLKHKCKIEALKKAEENILERNRRHNHEKK
jgi:hypothetical protein